MLDTGREDVSFLRLWNEAIRKYHVLQELEHAYERASWEHDDAARVQLQRDEAMALAEAVHALRRLGEGEARKRLVAYQAFLDGARTDTVRMDYCARLLDSFAPQWWVSAFTDLFFRGGFVERRGLPLRRWLKALLQRADFAGWAASKEFAAAGYNICVRRAQMCEVASYVRTSKEFRALTPDLLELSPHDMVVAALAAGEATSIRRALQKRSVDVRVKRVLRSMEVALRRVEGSEAERDVLRFKFGALRLWTGCSLLFFTLNPHDIHSPLLVLSLIHI